MSPLARHVLIDMPADVRARIMRRSSEAIFEPELMASVAAIIDDVGARGDQAVCDALARFDGFELTPAELRVSAEEFEAAIDSVSPALLEAIRQGIANSRAFNERVAGGASWREEIAPGHLVGEVAGPIDSAGLFVPSGKGSFPRC